MWGRRGNREQGTGNRNGGCRVIMKTYMLYRRRPFRMNAEVPSMSPLQGFQGFRVSFYRGNVSFVLVVSFRARLFLFPVVRACRSHRQGSADPFSLKTLHRRVFQALEPLKTLHWSVFRALDVPVPFALPFAFLLTARKSEFVFYSYYSHMNTYTIRANIPPVKYIQWTQSPNPDTIQMCMQPNQPMEDRRYARLYSRG